MLLLLLVTGLAFNPEKAFAAGEYEPILPDVFVGDTAHAPTLFLEPSMVVLGSTGSVSLIINAPEAAGDPPLRASVNVGELAEIHKVDQGSYRGVYTPPTQGFPQVAVLALWRETGPDAAIAFYRIPLFGVARVPITTDPGARVTVTVDDRPFGPFTAGADGRVLARVHVPPGVTSATVRAVGAAGARSSQGIRLDVPSYNRLNLAMVPHAIVADGSSSARAYLFYDGLGRREISTEDFIVDTELQMIRPIELVEGPLYRFDLVAPSAFEDKQASIGVRVRGDRASRAVIRILVGRQDVAHIAVDPVGVSHIADGQGTIEFRLWVRDQYGLGVDGVDLEVLQEPEGFVDSLELTSLGAGAYLAGISVFRIDPPDVGAEVNLSFQAEDVSAAAVLEITPWLPEEVVILSELPPIRADGQSMVEFTFSVIDSEGRRLDHLQPEISVSVGSIESLTALDEGGFRAEYLPPLIIDGPLPDLADQSNEPREELISIRVPSLSLDLPILLVPIESKSIWNSISLAVALGYQSNFGLLGAPVLKGFARYRLFQSEQSSVGVGIWTGYSRFGAQWEKEGDEESTAYAQINTIPLLISGAYVFSSQEWFMELGAGLGFSLASGRAQLDEIMDAPFRYIIPAAGTKVGLGRALGPGKVIVNLWYIQSSSISSDDIVQINGNFGGGGLSLGYGTAF